MVVIVKIILLLPSTNAVASHYKSNKIKEILISKGEQIEIEIRVIQSGIKKF